MPDKLSEALVLAGAGVTVVFVALGILMVAILLLSRLSPRDRQDKEDSAPSVPQEQRLSKESVAAMAVAMALAMEQQENASATRTLPAPMSRSADSPWAATGRERLMRSRAKPGRGWGRSSN